MCRPRIGIANLVFDAGARIAASFTPDRVRRRCRKLPQSNNRKGRPWGPTFLLPETPFAEPSVHGSLAPPSRTKDEETVP
jgi:hypothetical protein